MSDKKKEVTIDPNILIDSMEEIEALVDANVTILETVKKLIKRCIDSGLDKATAAGVAMAIHKDAAKKARKLVNYEDEEQEEKADDEQ